MAKPMNWVLLIGIAIVVVLVLNSGGFDNLFGKTETGTGTGTETGTTEGTTTVTGCLIEDTTLKIRAKDLLAGSVITTNVEIFDSSDNLVVSETLINSTVSEISTSVPTNFNGYAMIGNDDLQSTTDRGTEYYYAKVPFTIGCVGVKTLDIKIPAEGTTTFTGYDDGASESTWNVTVGSGETLVSPELKIQASALAYVGNPALDNPVAICVNATTLGDWDEIRPSNYKEKVVVPEFLSGKNIVGSCYVLPTASLKDYGTYRDYIILDASSGHNPGASGDENVFFHLVDKTYGKNDDLVWIPGFGDDSVLGTDADLGINSVTYTKLMYVH